MDASRVYVSITQIGVSLAGNSFALVNPTGLWRGGGRRRQVGNSMRLNYNVTLYFNRRLTRGVRGRILAVISVARWLGTPIRYGITNPSSVRPS